LNVYAVFTKPATKSSAFVSINIAIQILFPKAILPYYVYPSKGKAIPLQAWTGPEGYRRLRLADSKTIGT
jgi:hypothetical protein